MNATDATKKKVIKIFCLKIISCLLEEICYFYKILNKYELVIIFFFFIKNSQILFILKHIFMFI